MGYRTTVKPLRDTVSLVDADICPRKAIVTLSPVLTPVAPSAVENAKLLPQLCPFQACVDALIANSSLPANAVSADDAALESTGVPPNDTCGVKPAVVPVCEN